MLISEKTYNIIVIILAALLFYPHFASAEVQTLPPVKQNTCVNLPQLEFNTTYQNLTFVQKPSKKIVLIGKYMNRNGYTYNYTYCDTTELGDYVVNGCSDLSCWAYDFTVSPSGNDKNNANISLFLIVIGFTYAISFIGFFGKNVWVSIIGGMGMIALGLYMLNSGIVIYRDFMTGVFSWTTIGLGAFFALTAGVEQIQEQF